MKDDNSINSALGNKKVATANQRFPLRSGNDIYDVIANDLINDLNYIKDPNSFKYFHGEVEYNIDEYCDQLTQKTNVGMEFVTDYYNGLKLLKINHE